MLLLYLSAILLASCSASRKDMEVQKMFTIMEGEVAGMRDACFKELSITVEDLHDYEKAEEIPEEELCFYKCFYEKSFVLDTNGNVLTDLIKELPEVKSLEEAKQEQFMKCIKDANVVKSCKDMVKLEMCFDGLF